MDVKLIVISGTMRSGKTTVLSEASDILSSSGVVHAAIDLDGLGICQLPAGLADDLMFRNLASVWANYRAAGVTRLLLAELWRVRPISIEFVMPYPTRKSLSAG